MISLLNSWWKANSLVGVDPLSPYSERRRQIMTNHISVAVIVISILLLIVDTIDKLNRDALIYSDDLNHESGFGYRFVLAILLALININLSSTPYKKFARYILVYGISYVYLILPLQVGPVYDELYLWYPYGSIPFIVLPPMLFDYKTEKISYYLSLICLFMFPLFSGQLLDYFAQRELVLQEVIKVHAVFYRVAPTTIHLFIILCIHYLIYLTDENAVKLDRKNVKLSQAMEELKSTQNQLIRNEKMAIVGRLSSELTHEISTPISAIKANLSMLAYDQRHRLRLLLQIGMSCTPQELDQLGQLVRDMHEIAKNRSKDTINGADLKPVLTERFEGLSIDAKKSDGWIECFSEIGIENPAPYVLLLNSAIWEVIIDFLIGEFQQRQSFKISRTAIEQAEKLIHKLKSYSYSKDLSEVKPFSMAAVVYNSLDLLESKMKQVNCEVNLQKSLPSVLGQADEILQVINNLLLNAIQAMNYTGDLFISLEGDDEEQQLIIEDTGGGINLSLNEDVFEAFFTTKKKGEGSGLGLHICKQIVEKHQGKIQWSNTGKGVRFVVTLPASLQIEY